MSKFCKNCGAQLAPDVKFCASCGTKTQTAEQRQTRPVKKIWIPIVVALLVVALAISILPRFLTSGDLVKNGTVLEKKIKVQKETQVGDIAKDGWELQISPATFDEDVQLSMTVLSEEKARAHSTDGFVFYGSPVEIKISGKENVRLGEPVPVTVKIPKELLRDIAAEELFFAYYYDGVWEYYMPDNVNLKDGMATLNAHHFSFLGFGKPSEDDQIKTYAKNYASLQWESEQKTKKLTDALSRQFDDLFISMGVNSNSVRNQLAADVISYLENATIESGGVAPIDALAQMANAASKGQAGKQDFQNKLLEYTGKGLAACLEKIQNAPGEYVDKFASDVNILGNLSSALGFLVEGDSEGATESIANMLKGLSPVVTLADSTLNYIKESVESGIDYWTQREIEKAYQVYIGGGAGKYGYESGLEGDINGIFTTLGGGERMMNIKIIKKYCEKYGLKENELTQAERNRIIANAMTVLQRNFDNRKISEAEIGKKQQTEEAFIAQLKKEGLLSASSYQKFFGIDKNLRNFSIGDRLARLYKLKATVLSIMDEEAAAGISDEFLVKAIAQWVYWNEKGDRSGFYKYMREMGYIKEPIPLEKLPAQSEEEKPITTEPVELDPDSDTVPIASSGSFVCTTWINTSMDSFAVGGGTLTGANWSYSRGYRSYNLTGTYKAGETVSLSIAATMGEMGYQMDHKGNNLVMYLKVYDTNGKEIEGATQKIEILKSGSKSLSDAVSIAVPANASKVEMSGSFSCNWVTPHAVASETVAVMVKLSVAK